ncbi:MAG TPA: MgtC/SapB family protein, partial [Vicinamibacteria bacterium]|nr:MgtC/SapB family protein [Vicinamibacteria bacterium]
MDTPLGGALVALLLGLLLGLERERSADGGAELFAGIRTFPLISLCGYLGAAASHHGLPLAFPAVLLALGALVVASYVQPGREAGGATTEVAA